MRPRPTGKIASMERPPGLPRAAFLPRRLAILRGVRRELAPEVGIFKHN